MFSFILGDICQCGEAHCVFANLKQTSLRESAHCTVDFAAVIKPEYFIYANWN